MEQTVINALQAHEQLCMRLLTQFADKPPTYTSNLLYLEMIQAENERKLLQTQQAKN